MFTPIHRALGLEASDVSFDLIELAVEKGVEETADLDWKQAPYSKKDPKWQEEAAKDIAAMANSGGGWLVFGVGEDGEMNAASKIHPFDWSPKDEQRIRQVAYAKIGPPVTGLEFFRLSVPDGDGTGGVVMVRVPDSRDAPHFARKGDDAFVAPRRNGPHTVFMSDREIERGFRERFQYADDQAELLQSRFERACQALRPEDGVFLAIAAVPQEPLTKPEPVSEAEVTTYMKLPPMTAILRKPTRRVLGAGVVRKGMRQWLIRSYPGASYGFRKFLYDDGTVLGAYQLGLLRDAEEEKGRYPVGQTNHCMAVDLEHTVVDFITVLRAHAEKLSPAGFFRIRAGLIGEAGEPIYIRAFDYMREMLNNVDEVEPIVGLQPVTTEISPLSSPAEILGSVNDLALDLVNQSGIKDLRVIASPAE